MKTNQLQKNIPNKWQLTPVGDVFEFVKTYSFSRDNLTTEILSNDQVGCIHYGDIHSTYIGTTVDISKTKIPCINDKGFSPKEEELLINGDLIMADASEDYEGVGVTVSIHGIGKNKVVGGLHTFVLRDNKNKTTEYYRQYIFRNKEIRNKLQKVANGVSVYGISKTALSKMLLPIPAIPEQNRIVSVLETWDKSIEKLTKKINTKKQIKKGLMQDLLTGKKRLTGFKEKWNTLELSDLIGDIGDGGTPSRTKLEYFDGNIPWVVIGDIKPEIYTTEEKLTDLGLKKSSAKLWKAGSIILSTGATIGLVGLAMIPVSTKQGITGIELNEKAVNKYIYYWLDTKKQTLISFAHGSSFKDIRPKTLGKLKINLPNVKEQKAIADILTTVDKEITELEKKLSIIKDQKKYLLNNLITGVIRTPENLKIN